MTQFDRLHPALQHHIVNSLGWQSLRPLQEEAIGPLLDGEHALLLAPTAGGKTEAAFFPLLSQILTEPWPALSVVYVCPLRALLNNLETRLAHYCGLVGRRVALWHGDIGTSERRRILDDPPDCLLTTPESLEVILISRRSEKDRLFGKVRAVVVDEIHAFAGDDRGWHLLSVLERVGQLAGRDIQRVGLSATIGEPEQLLRWLTGASTAPRRTIAPPDYRVVHPEVTLDYVGTINNAATVISRLHQGEKRLVFCDSRSRVEELAFQLQSAGVSTFVSHSSIGRRERRRAEAAFVEGSSCVIAATSTLELGIDIGDLDRVIQIDAPRTVASFLQRLGRTGRRPGTQRNCLFLTVADDALIRAAGILKLWGDGYVEPVVPPASPFHILAQQIMALALQEGGIGSQTWWRWIGKMPGFAAMSQADVALLLRHMIKTGILSDDSGILWLGREGESSFGRKNFMDLFAVFTSNPLISVRHGHTHLGEVDPATFAMRHDKTPILLLSGRSWAVNEIDWDDRIAYVEPAKESGRSIWLSGDQPLHYRLCQSIRGILAGDAPPCSISTRAAARLDQIREDYTWIERDRTTVLRTAAGYTWWTFGGLCANAAIAAELGTRRLEVRNATNFSVSMDIGHDSRMVEEAIASVRAADPLRMVTPIEAKTIDSLKFSACLPPDMATRELQERLTDRSSLKAVLGEPATFAVLG